VLADKDGKEVYRGKDRSFVLSKLPSSTTVELQIWTENEGGAKSEAKTVTGRTKAEESSSSGGGGGGGPAAPAPQPPKVEEPKAPEAPKAPEEADPTGPAPVKEVRFKDIDTTFNKDQITFLAQQGVIAGVSETRYEPQRAITRAEFTALVVRLMGFEPAKYEGTFKDVEPDAWYAEYIATGVAHNVIKGMGNGIFAPNQEITREQASVILANVVATLNARKKGEGITFVDQDLISYWAVEQVELLAGMRMVEGYEDGTFPPLANLSRAEAAALIYRLKDWLANL